MAIKPSARVRLVLVSLKFREKVTGDRSRIGLENSWFGDVCFCSDSLSDFATCGSSAAAQQIARHDRSRTSPASYH